MSEIRTSKIWTSALSTRKKLGDAIFGHFLMQPRKIASSFWHFPDFKCLDFGHPLYMSLLSLKIVIFIYVFGMINDCQRRKKTILCSLLSCHPSFDSFWITTFQTITYFSTAVVWRQTIKFERQFLWRMTLRYRRKKETNK